MRIGRVFGLISIIVTVAVGTTSGGDFVIGENAQSGSLTRAEAPGDLSSTPVEPASLLVFGSALIFFASQIRRSAR